MGRNSESADGKRLLDPNGPRSVFGVLRKPFKRMAGTTRLELATSAVTGQRSNQLNYVPTRQINKMRNKQCLCGSAHFAYRACNCLRCTKERDSCPNRPQISAFLNTSATRETACTESSGRSRVFPTWAKPPLE